MIKNQEEQTTETELKETQMMELSKTNFIKNNN